MNFQFSPSAKLRTRIFNFQLREGYIFLLTVLFVGIIAFSVVGSYLLFATVALQTGYAAEQSAQALELARTCAEQAIFSLQDNTAYAGEETLVRAEGTCTIFVPAGTGNSDRVICTQGTVGSAVRNMEIFIDSVLPAAEISSWREVSSITACSS